MTDRHTVNTITSDALDALYEQLEAAENSEAQRQLATAQESFASATTRAARAEAAIERVRRLADGWVKAGPPPLGTLMSRWWDKRLIELLAALDEPAAGPAATEATDTQKNAMPAITTGLVVQPYRNDHGNPAWVFRCWGTDTCDGWLSLDHTSEQSARRARDRHVAEEHAAPSWTEPTHDHPCTATIEGRATPGGRPVTCTREAGHPENHVGPKQGSNGRVLWTDRNTGAVPHRRG